MEVARDWRKTFFAEMSAILRPKGFKKRSCRYLKTIGPVLQVIRFDTLRGSNDQSWSFRIYEGSSTEGLMRSLFSELEFDPDPECGPLFQAPMIADRNAPDPIVVESAQDLERAIIISKELLEQHTLPLLESVSDPESIVRYLEENPRSSVASRDKTKECLAFYRAISLKAEQALADKHQETS